jgi:hypothetical protein
VYRARGDTKALRATGLEIVNAMWPCVLVRVLLLHTDFGSAAADSDNAMFCMQTVLEGKAAEDMVFLALFPFIDIGRWQVWSVMGDVALERRAQV